MMLALARVPVTRLLRTQRSLFPIVGWIVGTAAVALVLRSVTQVSADRALLELLGPFVMPLVSFAVVGGALGGDGLVLAVQPLTRFGASGKRVALAHALVATAASALVCALVGLLLVVLWHAPSDPPLGHDVALTVYASALGGAAHGSFFLLGSAIAPRAGRGGALIANWLLGSARGYASVIVPYAHARSLLGGAPAMALSESTSAWWLVGITAVCVALATLRVRR